MMIGLSYAKKHLNYILGYNTFKGVPIDYILYFKCPIKTMLFRHIVHGMNMIFKMTIYTRSNSAYR